MATRLALHLLGGFHLEDAGVVITAVKTPRLQSLLAYLLLHGEAPRSRAHLAYIFWPDSSEAQARTNLRHQLHLLRQALPVSADLFEVSAQALSLRPGVCALDVADFEAGTGLDATRAQLQAAIERYQGDLLPGCYEDWLLQRREQLRQRFVEATERLIGLLEQEGAISSAVSYAQRLRQQDPLREEAHRLLMRLYAAQGDRAGVQRCYAACAAVLERELGIAPGPLTQRAYQRALVEAAGTAPSLSPSPSLPAAPVDDARPLRRAHAGSNSPGRCSRAGVRRR